jgi:hypothetical protein
MLRYTAAGALVGVLLVWPAAGLPGPAAPLAAQATESAERARATTEAVRPGETFEPRRHNPFEAGLRDGREEARGYTNGAWFGVPLALVSVTGPLGAVAAPTLALTLRPDAADVVRLEAEEAEYRAGFEEGFRRQTRRDRIIRAVQGSLAGILAYFAVQALFSGDPVEEGATHGPGTPQV